MNIKAILIISISTIILLIGYIIRKRWQSKESPTPFPICTRLPEVRISGRRPALAPNYKLQWDEGTKIQVYFYEGITPLTTKIVSIANEWTANTNVRFQITKKEFDSNVRVSFDGVGGYSSAVGIECNEPKYEHEPTMYLSSIDTINDSQEFKRIVLHEFGHALGLEHELTKASAKIPWDSAAVFEYYSRTYNWNKPKVRKQIFEPFTVEKRYDEFDASSIMIYAVGPPMVKKESNFSIPWPKELSKSDKKYIAIWYPKKH